MQPKNFKPSNAKQEHGKEQAMLCSTNCYTLSTEIIKSFQIFLSLLQEYQGAPIMYEKSIMRDDMQTHLIKSCQDVY